MYQYLKPIFSRYIEHFKIALPKRVVMSQTIRYSTLYCTIRGGKRQPNNICYPYDNFRRKPTSQDTGDVEDGIDALIERSAHIPITHPVVHGMIHIVVYKFR